MCCILMEDENVRYIIESGWESINVINNGKKKEHNWMICFENIVRTLMFNLRLSEKIRWWLIKIIKLEV